MLTTTCQNATLHSRRTSITSSLAVINAIATWTILKVAQGAYGIPRAVAVAQLFDQPKMRVERAAAQPPEASVSDIVANALQFSLKRTKIVEK